ncbi:MAG: histidinol-phosphate transaminase [Lachnospiraceae bacterium]|nr:histidinol-phosphate transaminase [Lachnospiraceae bacterium]
MNQWENNIRKVTPYVPGEQPQENDIIKLNTNENPYPPSPKVYERHRTMEVDRFSLYPDPSASELVEKLEEYYGLEKGQVFVGVGSDDVLSLAFLTFFNSKKPILFPDVTYSFYPVWAEVYRIPYECPPLDENFRIIPKDYERENGGVVIANPNAPTSLGMSISEIEKILLANQDVIVIIDEAYVDFGGETVLPLLDRFENLLIVRTYSKSRSMAGMRIGFAMGNKRLIQAMTDVKESINSYTMTMESICLGAASLEDEEYFQNNLRKIIDTRAYTEKELEKRGFFVLNSQTNFLFARHREMSGQFLFEELRKRKIFVRHFQTERIREYLRITIGTKEQMEKMLAALDEIMCESC